MALFNLTDMKAELKEVTEEGISFQDKQLKWNNADDVADVVAALKNQKIVHYLNLDGNTLGVEAAQAIGNALETHPEFRKALWKNIFISRLKEEIPVALKYMGAGLIQAGAQLTVLDLSDNALGPNGMVGLEEFLRSSVCYTLQELRLNNCGLGIDGGRMLSEAIIDCHRKSIEAGTPLKLKVFIAGRNRLENQGAKHIAKIFAKLKTLEEITMPQNSIYHDGIKALADGIKENVNLRILNLNDNTVTDKGAEHLQKVFEAAKVLREINFGDCLLKNNGAYLFAYAFEKGHTELEVVDLGFNEIGADAGLAVVQVMQNKPNLKKLILDGNQFGYEGREAIKSCMLSANERNALCSLDEDQSASEESEADDGEDYDDGTDYSDSEAEGGDETEEHHNDTTEEAENDYDDEYANDSAEDTAYVTSPTFNTKWLSDTSILSTKSVTFASGTADAATKTNENVADSTSDGNGNSNKPINAETFCLSKSLCTLEMFESLTDENKLEAFKAVWNQFNDDSYLLVLIFTTLKVAHLAKASAAALELATDLYKECFDYGAKTKQERRVLNYILMQLDLLRSEQKFNSPYNRGNCRFALKETIKQNKISSDYVKNVCNTLLEKLDFNDDADDNKKE